MRKFIFTLPIVIQLTILTGCTNELKDHSVSAITSADPGLLVRKNPDISSEAIDKLPMNTNVTLLKYRGKKQNINGKEGFWTQIKYNSKTGYVFGGYLTFSFIPEILTKEKISLLIGETYNTKHTRGPGVFRIDKFILNSAGGGLIDNDIYFDFIYSDTKPFLFLVKSIGRVNNNSIWKIMDIKPISSHHRMFSCFKHDPNGAILNRIDNQNYYYYVFDEASNKLKEMSFSQNECSEYGM